MAQYLDKDGLTYFWSKTKDKFTRTIALTQAEYDAIITKDPNTMYVVTDQDIAPTIVTADSVNAAYSAATNSQKQTARESLGAASNKNLLGNWYFRNPVNQRGQTSWTANGYTIDRWILLSRDGTGGSLNLTDSGLTLASTGALWTRIKQIFDNPITAPFTFTAKIASATPNADVRLYAVDGTSQVLVARAAMPGGAYTLTGTYTPTTSVATVFIEIQTVDASVTIECAKLELGSVSTLANDPPADFGEELRKCLRYYQIVKQSPFIGRATSANSAQFVVPLATPMRVLPVLSDTAGSNWGVQNAGGSYIDIESVRVYTAGFNTGYLTLYAEANGLFSAGAIYSLTRRASAGDLRISADL